MVRAWNAFASAVGSGLLAAVVVLVVVLAVSGVWIAVWSLWRTRGSTSQS